MDELPTTEPPTAHLHRTRRRALQVLFLYMWFGGLLGTWYTPTRPALDLLGRRRMILLVTVAALLYIASTMVKLARYGWIF